MNYLYDLYKTREVYVADRPPYHLTRPIVIWFDLRTMKGYWCSVTGDNTFGYPITSDWSAYDQLIQIREIMGYA